MEGVKDYFQNTQFIFGFLLSLVFVVLINLIEFDFKYSGPNCLDYFYEKGFPFYYSQRCDSPTFSKVLWFGLIGNIVFSIIVCSLVGLLFRLVLLLVSKDSQKI